MAGLIDPELEQARRERIQDYGDFLDDGERDNVYRDRIRQLLEDPESSSRLIVNVNDLRAKYPARIHGLLNDGFEELGCLQTALKDIVATIDPELAKEREEFFVGLEGSFGHRHVTPRTLKARFLGNVVCCEGIVTKCSLVHPKVVRSVHYCPATKKTVERRYTDLTSYDAFPTSSAYPTEDENKNPLETEYGLSRYKDHQTFSVQELPEVAPPGQLPRSVDVVADNDLADRCKPGDRVRVVGVFRCLPNKQSGFTSGSFRTIQIANNIQLLSKESTSTASSSADIKLIKKFQRMKHDHFDVLARSLAPSIHGHEEVKRAILALLLGGTEKILKNGTRLRGDINVLLIGDPSVAKSQLLRYVLQTAPRAIATTGRGSSGVGLTAAVTTDQETGERRLEAGAMVLGDRGVVCIDEFDKMSDIDRTAIHEVMEQGRVSIAKAGIHAKLNARCSVLAAANPVFGRYDIYKSPMENIGMQDSLLSRFDLCFVLLDQHQTEEDKAIAEHVVKLHVWRDSREEDGAVLDLGTGLQALTTFDLDADAQKHQMDLWEKNKAWAAAKPNEKIVTMDFLRKYISLAKHTKPEFQQEAATFIAEKYADLRGFDEKKSDRERTTPVTARTLETMIRLATGHAKARMSKTVQKVDAEKSFHLLYFACFKEKPKERLEEERQKELKKKRKHDDQERQDQDSDSDAASGDEVLSTRGTRSRAGREENGERERKRRRSESPEEEESLPAAPTAAAAISVDRYRQFQRHVRAVFDESGQGDRMRFADFREAMQRKVGRDRFSDLEFRAAVDRLSDDNSAMVVDEDIYII